MRGRPQARKLLEALQREMLDVRWQVFASAEVGDRLFVEGVDAYRTPDGTEIATPYAGVLELRDGLVIGWRDYVDLSVAASQRAGGAGPPADLSASRRNPSGDVENASPAPCPR